MSVATMLGVDNVEAPAMVAACESWFRWGSLEPSLTAVDDMLDLPIWTRSAPHEDKDAALRSLSKLGSSEGGNDPNATTALTWALVPGAATIAHRLSDLAPNIDELVASHLWTSTRTFEWDRRRSTAASILRDTRRGVLRELGVGEWARREDRAWSQTTTVDPDAFLWQHFTVEEPETDPATELLELLTEATSAGAISDHDRALLVDLALTSDRIGGKGQRRQRAGLTGRSVIQEVGERWGIAPSTVQRRADKTMGRLADLLGNDESETDEFRVTTQYQILAVGA